MSKKKFGLLLNYEKIDGGFVMNIFTIFRFAFQTGDDSLGNFLQFNFGLYRLNLTLQLGLDE